MAESSAMARIGKVATANADGQIDGLDAGADYLVFRRPTPSLAKERAEQMIDEVKHFVQDQRDLTKKQVDELNERFAEPARAKVGELRADFEKRFDEMVKTIDTRFEKLEVLVRRKPNEGRASAGMPGETPGEMPTGTSSTTAPKGPETATASKQADATDKATTAAASKSTDKSGAKSTDKSADKSTPKSTGKSSAKKSSSKHD